MVRNRPVTTLFLLSSLDGKISTGDGNQRDFDNYLPHIPGVKEGLNQYYNIEKTTNVHSFMTGKVFAKLGINKPTKKIKKMIVCFIVVDNAHLTRTGVHNLCTKAHTLYLVTKNAKHPAVSCHEENLVVLQYKKVIDFKNLFAVLKKKHGVKQITIQSGGTMNATLLRDGLIDRISLVIAPCLVGGKTTPTVIDGPSLRTVNDLQKIRALKLIRAQELQSSYVHLVYDVKN